MKSDLVNGLDDSSSRVSPLHSRISSGKSEISAKGGGDWQDYYLAHANRMMNMRIYPADGTRDFSGRVDY